MALTRKFLTAMGIESEKIDEIINAHSETVEALKKERDSYEEDAKKLKDVQKELDKANKTIEEHSKDGFEKKYNDTKKEFESYKAEVEAKATATAKDRAYRELLKEAGISEKRIDAVMKVTKLDEVEMDGDKIKDAEKLTTSIKEEWKDFLTQTHSSGASTSFPPAGAEGALTKEQIYAKDEKGKYKLDAKARQDALAKIM